MTENSLTQRASAEGAQISAAFEFIEAGENIQLALVGSTPGQILVTAELNEDQTHVTFATKAVSIPPDDLVDVLEILLDTAREVKAQYVESITSSATVVSDES